MPSPPPALRFQLLSGCHANRCPYEEEDDRDGFQGATGCYLRLYGMTAEGHSVALVVYGWRPYLYVRLPDRHNARAWQDAVLRRLGQGLPSAGLRRVQVQAHQVVARQKLDGFTDGEAFPFLRVTLRTQGDVRKCVQLLRQPLRPSGAAQERVCDLYEANVAPFTRYCIDQELVTSGWVEVPVSRLAAVPQSQRRTVSRVEARLNDPTALRPVPSEQGIAPLVIASFDIECASADGSFPNPQRPSDKCIQIATAFQRYGEAKPYLRHIVCLKACDPIDGVTVEAVPREEEVLLCWARTVRDQNPDVLLGYNILKFDLEFMWERARLLQVSSVFSQLGRDRYEEVKFVTKVMASNAAGSNEYRLFDAALGRVQLDLLPLVRQSHKLEFYSLNYVSEQLLGDKKVDLSPGRLFELWDAGTTEGLTEIAVYCCKDVDLPLRLLERLKTVPNLVEMSRVCHVAVDDLITRGQQIKVMNQILTFCRPLDMLVPTPDAQDGPPPEEKFQGATVIEPKRGAYIDAELHMSASEGVTPGCVTCLDFKSLYPSIMRGWNLCYSTLVWEGDPYDARPGVRYSDWGTNAQGRRYRFAQNRPGVLPRILKELAGARSAAKREMKRASDPNLRSVLDGKQLALKVSANSIYGFTGVTRGFLPQREIAETVTRNGRRMIEETSRIVTASYPRSEVVYGDTDSVMVLFRHPDGRPATLRESFDLGTRAAEEVTKTFPPPVELEFEKVNRNFLLYKKKRYVGFKYESPDEDGVIDAKGIQIVRRDNMPLVREGLMRIVELILRHGDVEGAKAHIRGMVTDLLAGKVPTDKLLLSKALSGNYAKLEGHSMPAHVSVAAKRRQRDPNDRVLSGERVPYVFVTLPGRTARDLKKTKQAERAECPAFAAGSGLTLDYEFYWHHQLKKPLDQLMALVVPDPSTIYREELRRGVNRLHGLRDITAFFKRKAPGDDRTAASDAAALPPPPDMESGGIFAADDEDNSF